MDPFQINTDEIVDKLLLLVVLVCAALMIFRDLRTLRRVIASRKRDTVRWVQPPLPLRAAAENAKVLSFGAGPTRAYAYQGAAQLVVMLVETLGLASLIASAVAAVVLIRMALQSNIYATMDFIKCLLLGDLAAGWFLGAGLINLLPTLWLGEEGIVISAYFASQVLIPWADVVDVRRWPLLPGFYIVRARQITPMHQLYGWLARTRLPGFIIHESIDGHDQLIWELRRRIPAHATAREGGG